MSDWFDQYYGCDGPCPEYERIVNTPQIYSSITEDYKSCLPTPTPFDCTLIAHCTSGGTGGSVTPILIVSNSMSIRNPVGGEEYIGEKSGGFNSSTWNLLKTSFTYEYLNCGVPFPHTINGSVSNAINVCGNLFVQGHRETVNVHIKIYKFDCVDGSSTPTLTLLFTNILEIVAPSGVATGVNKCWSMDVSNEEDKITECTTHFMISFSLIQEGSGVSLIKSSYKATIEKVA